MFTFSRHLSKATSRCPERRRCGTAGGSNSWWVRSWTSLLTASRSELGVERSECQGCSFWKVLKLQTLSIYIYVTLHHYIMSDSYIRKYISYLHIRINVHQLYVLDPQAFARMNDLSLRFPDCSHQGTMMSHDVTPKKRYPPHFRKKNPRWWNVLLFKIHPDTSALTFDIY